MGSPNAFAKTQQVDKDLFIGETVRSILDVMDFTKKESLPGLLIFIDFQKAFDTLERNSFLSV